MVPKVYSYTLCCAIYHDFVEAPLWADRILCGPSLVPIYSDYKSQLCTWCSAPTAVEDSENASDNPHGITLDTFPLRVLLLILLDASAPLIRRDIYATDHGLSVSHARIDIDVLQFDVQRAVCWPHEPAVDLPAQV